MNNIWNYYCFLAEKLGRDHETQKQLPFSLEIYFPYNKANVQNRLVRAFLGDETVCLEANESVPESEIMRYTSKQTPPYEEQIKAISNALSYPVSLVQGPPGTGKTEMILNLISVIHGIYPEKTIAVVSSNNEALSNIYQKIIDDKDKDPMLERLYNCFSELGRSELIKQCRKKLVREGNRSADFIDKKIDPEFLRNRPAFSSTVHSLIKIFRTDTEEKFTNQFDYVIIDECSQVSILQGLAAMSCAKNIVLIGDNNQLSPVITDKAKEVPQQYKDVPEIYRESDGKSFLSVCGEIFKNAKTAFLNEHYRCHPSIIDFCNKYVYGGELDVKTKRDGEFRMRAVWYEGDYCEELYTEESNDGKKPAQKQKYNQKQIEIFVKEELPRISKLTAEKMSVAVLCPFRNELHILKERLDELGQKSEENDDDEGNIPQLTIHKAQGKGYDVVYFLTVDDYYRTDAPWCQKMRMVNVAVSRAKKEFCIITSSQWLPQEIQKKLTGNAMHYDIKSLRKDDDMFYCRLLEYISESCPSPQGDYGLHKSEIESVFDKIPYFRSKINRRDTDDNDKEDGPFGSAPEKCMYEALKKALGNKYSIYREVPLKWLKGDDSAEITDIELALYAENARLDFVICIEDSVKLIIETDGSYHRGSSAEKSDREKARSNDEKKNSWINDILKAEDIFIRKPTDGSSSNEIEYIESILEKNTNTSIKIRKENVDVCERVDLKNGIISKLNEVIKGSLLKLKEFTGFGEPTNESLRTLLRFNYSNAADVSYNNADINNLYICRYGMVYAYEYALMYDIVMRSMKMNIDNNTDNNLRTTSFGCGSLLDALSLAYAKARLVCSDPDYDKININYMGIDKANWENFFIPLKANEVYVSGVKSTNYEEPEMSELNEKIRGCFKRIQFYNNDLEKYCEFKSNSSFERNVIMFPKIINELDDEEIEKITQTFETIDFNCKEYYICASHSRRKCGKGRDNVNKIISSINRNGDFDVCSDIYEIMGENADDFEAAWLGGGIDSLTDVKDNDSFCGEDPCRRSCYVFESSFEERSNDCRLAAELNSDFGSPEALSYLWTLNIFAKTLPYEILSVIFGIPAEEITETVINQRIRVMQVVRVSQIAFQIIRLKKKQHHPPRSSGYLRIQHSTRG